MKKIIRNICYLILRFLYPAISFRHYNYPLLEMVIWGVKQRLLLSRNCNIPWPVHPTSQIIAFRNIKIGTLAPGLSIGCFIDARNGIEFGENVWMGPKVSIISMDHDLLDYDRYITADPIVIGKNSLLANNCTILPGVVLGQHTVVAAGAVVTKSFPEGNQLLAGIPAKVVKKLDGYEGKCFQSQQENPKK
jgi:acetyltransferase-like isoleucine patch superfamily enzyme